MWTGSWGHISVAIKTLCGIFFIFFLVSSFFSSFLFLSALSVWDLFTVYTVVTVFACLPAILNGLPTHRVATPSLVRLLAGRGLTVGIRCCVRFGCPAPGIEGSPSLTPRCGNFDIIDSSLTHPSLTLDSPSPSPDIVLGRFSRTAWPYTAPHAPFHLRYVCCACARCSLCVC